MSGKKSVKVKEIEKIVSDLVKELEEMAKRGYIFRGINKKYNEESGYKKGDGINSTLYRWITKEGKNDVFTDWFFPHEAEKTIVENARALLFTSQKKNIEILTDLQHYGGKTNLIDFSHDYRVALFFACNGAFGKDGELIMLEKEKIQSQSDVVYEQEDMDFPFAMWLVAPVITKSSKNRVNSQKSVFVRPKRGYISRDVCEIKLVESKLKRPILNYLKGCGITKANIYKDLMGFIDDEKNFESAMMWFYRGESKQRSGNHKGAIRDYGKARSLNPENPNIYNNRGVSKLALGEFVSAIRDFNKTISLEPNYADAYSNRGAVRMETGKYKEALKNFHEAVRLGSVDAHWSIGVMYAEGIGVIKNEERAVEYYHLGAEQGSSLCQRALGSIYFKGWEGSKPNYYKAYIWLSLVAIHEKMNRDGLLKFNRNMEINAKESVINNLEFAEKELRKSGEFHQARLDAEQMILKIAARVVGRRMKKIMGKRKK